MGSRIRADWLTTFAVLFASGAHADAVLDWNEVALAEIAANGQLPTDGARTMAMVHVAVFDAVNAVIGGTARCPRGARARRCVDGRRSRKRRVCRPRRLVSVARGVARRSLRRHPRARARGPAKHAGTELGKRAASACLALRAGDGTGAPNRYSPHTSAGVYVPTSLPVASEWPEVEPWSMRSPAEFRPAPPPVLTSEVWARDFAEVKRLGAKDSQERSLRRPRRRSSG